MYQPINLIAIGALCYFLPVQATPVGAQELTTISQAATRGDLSGARSLARQLISKSPNAPVAHQVLGILLVADGQIRAAADQFRLACEQGPQLKPTATGLEPLDRRGTILHEALNRQKAQFALEAGIAAARNNLGAAKILLNKADDGLNDLDAATVGRPDWSVPWVNGALAWSVKHKPLKAKVSGRKAIDLGDQTARIYTILAEAEMQLHRTDQAQTYLRRAELQDPDYPYALYLRSILNQAANNPRNSERDYIRALALAPVVAAEGRYIELFDRFSVGGGNESEDHQSLKLNGQPASWTYMLNFARDRQQVDGRANAYQRRDTTDLTLGRTSTTDSTTLSADFIGMGGGLPGSDSGSVSSGFAPTPGSTLQYNRSDINLTERWNTDQRTRLMLHTTYQHKGIENSLPATLQKLSSREEQMGAEGTVDRVVGRKTTLRAGLSWLQNKLQNEERSLSPSGKATFLVQSPIQPNGQVLPVGTYANLQAFLLAEHQFSDRTTGAIGGEYGSVSGRAFAMPYADLKVRLTSQQSLHFSVYPSLFGAGQDLMPIPQAVPIVTNPISRQDAIAPEANQSPLLPGATGRALNYEASWTTSSRSGAEITATLFHRRIDNYLAINADPRLSSTIPLFPISHGEASGLQAQIVCPLPAGFAISAASQYQNTRAKNSNGFTGIDNAPQWQNRLSLSWAERTGWSLAVDTYHVGARTIRTLGKLDSNGIDGSCVRTAPDASTINLHISYRLSDRSTLFLNAYQLTGSSFYPGFPAGRSIVAGYTSSF